MTNHPYGMHKVRCNPFMVWSEGALKGLHAHTHQWLEIPIRKIVQSSIWWGLWDAEWGKRNTKGEQAVFKGCFQLPGQPASVFVYKVFPITVALSVSGSISSEFLCSSCQTYGINQGFGAGALAAGMLTAWQTRGSGVMESPSLWLDPGRRMRGGGGR